MWHHRSSQRQIPDHHWSHQCVKDYWEAPSLPSPVCCSVPVQACRIWFELCNQAVKDLPTTANLWDENPVVSAEAETDRSLFKSLCWARCTSASFNWTSAVLSWSETTPASSSHTFALFLNLCVVGQWSVSSYCCQETFPVFLASKTHKWADHWC